MQYHHSCKNPLYPTSICSFVAMHTMVEVLMVGCTQAEGERLAHEVQQRVWDMERRFNRFDITSPLSVVNTKAAAEAVSVDDELYMALEVCEVFRRGTKGYFSVAPTSVVGLAPYLLNASQHTVQLCSGDVQIDMGGFAKGFAAEQIKTLLIEAGIGRGVVNFGNSSIAAIGCHPYGEWWGVGVENPLCKGTQACEVRLCNSAMSLSGRTPNGEYHIINPHTGVKVAQDELILVEGRSALVAEVLSTALYAAPKLERGAILSQFAGYEATEIYCTADGVKSRKIE